MNRFLPYDPGELPIKPAPDAGHKITIKVSGLPPYKDKHFSIRNSRHKIHSRFKALRNTAIKVMAGRAPYRNAIHLEILIYASKFEQGKTLSDYFGGIMDSLDGSHGCNFTYLPIIYEDDCQVCGFEGKLAIQEKERYEVVVTFI